MKFLNIKKINNGRRGFSLLELVLAIAIFSLGSVAMATLLIDSNISTKLSQERVEALSYAKETLGAVRAIRNGSWDALTTGVHGLDNTSGWVFASSSDLIASKYTRSIEVTETDDNTKDVQISISWNLTPSRVTSVTLNTILTDWVALPTAAAGPVAPSTLGNGLVVHYKMNDNTANTTVMDSILTQNGTSVRNTSLLTVAGKVNTALNFNGTGDFIDLGNPSNLRFSGVDKFSFSFWVNWQGSANAYTSILSREDVSQGYTVLIKSNNKLAVYLSGGSVQFSMDGLGSSIGTGWKHIVVICDSSSGIQTYVNGVLDYNKTGSYNFGLPSVNVFLGKSFFANRLLSGSLDDFRIYNRVLTTGTGGEVEQLYNNNLGTEGE